MNSSARCRRVAHNLLQSELSPPESIARCIETAVDMVEIDVIGPPWSSTLVVAHDQGDLDAGAKMPFVEALEIVASGLPATVEINIDLKTSGYEERVVAALQAHGLAERALVSTMEDSSLKLLRARHRQIRLAWSLPRMRRNPLHNPVTAVPAMAVLTYVRWALPGVAANRIRRGEIDALMAHWRLVTPRLADAVRGAGGELYAWTVDDAQRIADLERIGVTGVISNDPRLFDEPSQT